MGDDDLAGLLPACGATHDVLHDPLKAEALNEKLRTTQGLTLQALADRYVLEALDELSDEGRLPEAIAAEAVRRGFMLAHEAKG
jgi:hypothetical protein